MKWILVALLFVTQPAFSKSALVWNEELAPLLSLFGETEDYQIGATWGKKAVTEEALKAGTPEFVRAAMATARLGGGTSFYLGKFNGHHVMATNHHVLPKKELCSVRTAVFPFLKKQFKCKIFFGEWNAIDLALFSIDVTTDEDAKLLAGVAKNFDFSADFYPGQELITIGFGGFMNAARNLVANADEDCKVYSGKNDFRFIADPDRINPAEYKAWSFSTGCDVSHGDSGSAMVDRKTGDVLGIIWTTATAKPERMRSASHLTDLLKSEGKDADIWDWLSFAVPAPKMRDYLKEFLASDKRPADENVVKTIEAVLE